MTTGSSANTVTDKQIIEKWQQIIKDEQGIFLEKAKRSQSAFVVIACCIRSL